MFFDSSLLSFDSGVDEQGASSLIVLSEKALLANRALHELSVNARKPFSNFRASKRDLEGPKVAIALKVKTPSQKHLACRGNPDIQEFLLSRY